MSKIALAIGLAGLLLATASTTGSAMSIVPLSKSVISGASGDLDLVGGEIVGATAGEIVAATGAGAIVGTRRCG